MNRPTTAHPAPHPFRKALAMAAPDGPPARHPLRLALSARQPLVLPKRPAMQDLRDFLLAYCACFIAAMAFIA